MKLAFIIPTIGRPKDLRACLLSIKMQSDELASQVIIIDDFADLPLGIDDLLVELPIEIYRNAERKGAAHSRNRAIELLKPEIDAACFLDDDSRLPDNWSRLVREQLTADRAAITGPVRRFDRGLVAAARQLRYDRRYESLNNGEKVDFLAGGNAAVWKSYLVKAGGFPDTVSMSDRFLVQRLEALGAGCHYIADLYVLHRNSKGLRAAIREAWRAGKLDNTPLQQPISERLRQGLGPAFGHINFLPALLNVGLDAIYLWGRSVARKDGSRFRDETLDGRTPK